MLGGVSIKDIAREAGVSHSTVSRALRNSPLVNCETAERIQKLARHMGYSPDTIARSLVTGKTNTIGVVVTSIVDPFVAGIVQAIESQASQQGYTVILASSAAQPVREMEAVRMLREKRIDGIIVTSSRVGSLYANVLDQLGIPIVLINTHAEGGTQYTYSVTIDNEHGGYTATQHLIAQGHERIAYISGSGRHSDDVGRMAGYRRALAEANFDFDNGLILSGDGMADGGIRAVDQLLALPNRPTAVFCYNDITAIGFMSRARELGLSVPSDIAIVGFDDISFSSLIWPTLTTIAQPIERMGSCAVDMMMQLLKQRGDGGVHNQVLQGHLVNRAST